MNENKKSTSTITIVTIVLLVLFFPVGLLLMWLKTQWPKPVKWIVTSIFALFIIGDAYAFSHAPSPAASQPVITKAPLTATPTPTIRQTPTPSYTPTSTQKPSQTNGISVSLDQITNGLGLNMQPVSGQSNTYVGIFEDKVGSSLRVTGNKQNVSKAVLNINGLQQAQSNADVQNELNFAIPEYVSNAFPSNTTAKQWVANTINTISNNDKQEYQEQSNIIDSKKITVKVNKTIGFIEIDIEKN